MHWSCVHRLQPKIAYRSALFKKKTQLLVVLFFLYVSFFFFFFYFDAQILKFYVLLFQFNLVLHTDIYTCIWSEIKHCSIVILDNIRIRNKTPTNGVFYSINNEMITLFNTKSKYILSGYYFIILQIFPVILTWWMTLWLTDNDNSTSILYMTAEALQCYIFQEFPQNK